MEKMLATSISPFPTMFSTFPKPIFNTSFTFILSSADASNLDKSKILSFGKELIGCLVTQKTLIIMRQHILRSNWVAPYNAPEWPIKINDAMSKGGLPVMHLRDTVFKVYHHLTHYQMTTF